VPGLLGLLMTLLILAIVIYVVKLIMDMLPLPDPVKLIAYLILGLVGLIVLMNLIGVQAGRLNFGHWSLC
jgi:predicted membrane channel-forming protein YqfA (hemolysin III family)